MKKKAKTKKKAIIITCIVLALGTLTGVSIYTYRKIQKPPVIEDTTEPSMVTVTYEYNVPDESGRYTNDVAYDDSLDVSKKCLEYPFKKSDAYIPNKELARTTDPYFFEYSQKFATDFLTTLLGTGYRAVGDDPAGYVSEMMPYFNDTSTFTIGPKTRLYAKEILTDSGNWIRDNEVQADVEVKTAGYLIYQDIYVYIRGELTITPYNCNASVMPYFIQGFDMKNGGSYVFEIGCEPSVNEEKAMNVVSFKILGEI